MPRFFKTIVFLPFFLAACEDLPAEDVRAKLSAGTEGGQPVYQIYNHQINALDSNIERQQKVNLGTMTRACPEGHTVKSIEKSEPYAWHNAATNMTANHLHMTTKFVCK